MAEDKSMRLKQVAGVINVGISTVISHLQTKGFKVDNNPNAKINFEQLELLAKDFKADHLLNDFGKKEESAVAPTSTPIATPKEDSPVAWYRSNDTPATKVVEPAPVSKAAVEPEKISAASNLGLKVIGKIDLNPPKKAEAPKPEALTPPVVEKPAPAPVVIEKPVEVAKEVIVEKPAPQPEIKQETPTPVVQTPVVEKVAVVEPVKELKETPKAEETLKETPKAEETLKEISKAEEALKETPKAEEAPKETPKAEETPKETVTTPVSAVSAPKPIDKKQDKFAPTQKPAEKAKVVVEPEIEPELIEAKADLLRGLKILGKIELPVEQARGSKSNNNNNNNDNKRKRKRVKKGEKVVEVAATGTPRDRTPKPADSTKTATKPTDTNRNVKTDDPTKTNRPATGQVTTTTSNTGGNRSDNNSSGGKGKKGAKGTTGRRQEISVQEVSSSIKATYARLSGTTSGKNFGADKRRTKRRARAEAEEERLIQEEEALKVLRVTEFISANDLSSLMNVSVQEVISVCMSMGMFVSINQRIDAESITLIADEFGFEVQFISAEEEIKGDISEIIDLPEDMTDRAPVVTIMGHVDHGKTSLLDYIRRTRVAASEAGGITQHIGAYSVQTESGREIAFLDTPGHEAFTAMRARGAKVTDVVIIVIASDDSIMPQTREAINHAQNAGVPIVFAFSKIDKAGANTEKIREALANMNILVEDWGGKYQSQEISSKSGAGIADLLEKVLLEADLLELKANPNRNAMGTVIEASLDKGRGYLSTILVQNGTLKIGDALLAGSHYGRVKAMFNSMGEKVKEAGPATPVQLLGLNGAPQAGDIFNVMNNDREAREIANKREQIIREQSIRTRKHITLDEIGRRKAVGNFKELNVIVKGDVDGSVEALSDSLLKLSTEEVQVNIIHKAVGQIAESDINLAIASDAIVIGFQVRPSVNAKKLAEQEQIEIRLYSIIYNAINEIKDAMLGLLEPTVEEVITGNIEIRETFKITKVGTVAGCYVTDGIVKRNNRIRILRDFIVIFEGEVLTLKRFKDDVNEVRAGYECGLSIKNYNDLEIGDVVESYELKEVKRTL
jgi:translation initiation factor IF-2